MPPLFTRIPAPPLYIRRLDLYSTHKMHFQHTFLLTSPVTPKSPTRPASPSRSPRSTPGRTPNTCTHFSRERALRWRVGARDLKKETYYKAKETYYKAKETYYKANIGEYAPVTSSARARACACVCARARAHECAGSALRQGAVGGKGRRAGADIFRD